MKVNSTKVWMIKAGILFLTLFVATLCFARDLEYKGLEFSVRVTPGEPTQIQFPGHISGGFKKKLSSLALDRKDSDLIIFANEGITESGEAIIVRLEDGRSYSMRIKRATESKPRDSLVRVEDDRSAILASTDEEPAYKERNFEYARPSQVSGLMRELTLVSEFGKEAITGYRASDSYKGELVINDGALEATIDRIYIGANLWGYVLSARNLLDQTQKINPATFRIDGTRAISAESWELAPKALNAEQQLARKDSTKIYIITKAKR